jgi:transglutaminase-like putative cysteine protease
MKTLINQYKLNPTIRLLALKLIEKLPQKDFYAEIEALYSFVKYDIRYVRDIKRIETIQTPVKTLELRAGDCDDKVILLGALLSAIGVKTRLVAVGFEPENYSHVSIEAEYHGKWLNLETTEPVNMGWQPDNIKAQMVVPI